MAEERIPLTAMITLFELFEYLYLNFGLLNGAASFRHFIDEIKMSLETCYFYMDDGIVASENEEQHKELLRILFEWFKK